MGKDPDAQCIQKCHPLSWLGRWLSRLLRSSQIYMWNISHGSPNTAKTSIHRSGLYCARLEGGKTGQIFVGIYYFWCVKTVLAFEWYCWWKKSQTTTWDVSGMYKNLVNNGLNYQPQLVIAGFLNHQQYQDPAGPMKFNNSCDQHRSTIASRELTNISHQKKTGGTKSSTQRYLGWGYVNFRFLAPNWRMMRSLRLFVLNGFYSRMREKSRPQTQVSSLR